MGHAGELLKKLTNAIEEKYALKLEKDHKDRESVSTASSYSTAIIASRSLRSDTAAANENQCDLLESIKQRITSLYDNSRILLRDWFLPLCPPIPLVVDHVKEAYYQQNQQDLEARLTRITTKLASSKKQNVRQHVTISQLKLKQENEALQLQEEFSLDSGFDPDVFGGSGKRTKHDDSATLSNDVPVVFNCFKPSILLDLSYESFIRYNPVSLFQSLLQYLSLNNTTQAAWNVIQAIHSAVNLSSNISVTGPRHARTNNELNRSVVPSDVSQIMPVVASPQQNIFHKLSSPVGSDRFGPHLHICIMKLAAIRLSLSQIKRVLELECTEMRSHMTISSASLSECFAPSERTIEGVRRNMISVEHLHAATLIGKCLRIKMFHHDASAARGSDIMGLLVILVFDEEDANKDVTMCLGAGVLPAGKNAQSEVD